MRIANHLAQDRVSKPVTLSPPGKSCLAQVTKNFYSKFFVFYSKIPG